MHQTELLSPHPPPLRLPLEPVVPPPRLPPLLLPLLRLELTPGLRSEQRLLLPLLLLPLVLAPLRTLSPR